MMTPRKVSDDDDVLTIKIKAPCKTAVHTLLVIASVVATSFVGMVLMAAFGNMTFHLLFFIIGDPIVAAFLSLIATVLTTIASVVAVGRIVFKWD